MLLCQKLNFMDQIATQRASQNQCIVVKCRNTLNSTYHDNDNFALEDAIPVSYLDSPLQ